MSLLSVEAIIGRKLDTKLAQSGEQFECADFTGENLLNYNVPMRKPLCYLIQLMNVFYLNDDGH